jgi:inositol 1,4,5-triphosphate receptor type 1
MNPNPMITTTKTISLTNKVLNAIDFRKLKPKKSVLQPSLTCNINIRDVDDDSKSVKTEDEKTEKNSLLEKLNEGPELSQQALDKYKELYSILDCMIELCVNETALSGDGGVLIVKKSRKNNQRLLRNMGVHCAVLELTKIAYEKVEDVRMKLIMCKAHQFLQSFCYENPRNQSLLHEKIDFTNYPANEWEAATVVAIFKVS